MTYFELKKKLRPFLLDEKKINYLDIFDETIKSLVVD